MDHATAKSQPGGDNGGLTIPEYISILPLVINADKPPTNSGIAILIKNLFKLISEFILFCKLYVPF